MDMTGAEPSPCLLKSAGNPRVQRWFCDTRKLRCYYVSLSGPEREKEGEKKGRRQAEECDSRQSWVKGDAIDLFLSAVLAGKGGQSVVVADGAR